MNAKGEGRVESDFAAHVLLLLMTLWLLSIAGSSTASACLFIGASLFFAMKVPSVRIRVGEMGMTLAAAIVALILAGNFIFDLGENITGMLGRDTSLTGRTEIWNRVLNEDINPLLGAGFYSFWLGDRPENISGKFWFHLNEAHNGYLDTYLNSGLLGVFLLLALLLSSTKAIQKELVRGRNENTVLKLSYVASIAIYNLTESAFNRMDIVWLALLLVIVEYPRRAGSGSGETEEWTRQVTPNQEAAAAV